MLNHSADYIHKLLLTLCALFQPQGLQYLAPKQQFTNLQYKDILEGLENYFRYVPTFTSILLEGVIKWASV